MKNATKHNKFNHVTITLLCAATLLTLPWVANAERSAENSISAKSLVVYPPETVGVSISLEDTITLALVSEFEQQGIQVHDYRPRFKAMADESDPAKPFVLTDEVKHLIAKESGAKMYVDSRLFQFGNELRFSISLRRADGNLVLTRAMKLANESDLPIAVSRLVESLLTRKQVDETLTLNNATKGETRNRPNRMNLEVYTGMLFGMSIGVDDMQSHPVVAFDSRFELDQVMIQFNLGLGINGSATYGDMALAANYYLTHGSIAPYVGIGGGVFLGDKWSDEDDLEDASGVFGGQFFPQVGVEFLRSAAIHLHVDARYTGNISGDKFGHGPVALVGIGF